MTEYAYDCDDNLAKVWDANHPSANQSAAATQVYLYDELNRLKPVTQPWAGAGGGSAVTAYGYDIQGHLTAVTDANGNVTTYTYGDRGLMTRQVSPVSGQTDSAYNEQPAAFRTSVCDRVSSAAGHPVPATSPRQGSQSMNVHQFIAKWSRVALTERSASQQHFLDLCELFGHGKPADVDPEGESFTFEKGAAKYGGGRGWADVWKRGFFAWEYKGQHKDLVAAYDQLLRYREALENPPLLVVSDLDRVVVHTNFTGRPAVVHDIRLQELDQPAKLDVVRWVFLDPERLRPGATREAITQEAAGRFAAVAQTMRARGLDARAVARFLDRVVFLLFAQSIDLLPERLVSRLLANSRTDPVLFARFIANLFAQMADGGFFGADRIRRFDGDLFADATVLQPTPAELEEIYQAGRLDWSAIDPSVLGTLFERGLDPNKRSQLGAHYTSRQDIETLVEPVVLAPLRREWSETRRQVENLLATGKKEPTEKDRARVPAGGPQGPAWRKARYEVDLLLRHFWERLCHVRVLDPACGSGNFLYVALQKLKDLEKELILYAMSQGLPSFLPLVGPWQLHGIEINPYAFELAQMSVWIGYLQWIRENGFGEPEDPVLRPMDSFENKDAILDLSAPENPREPAWPTVDFIVGNPPFLGGKKLRAAVGNDYVDRLFELWEGRVPAEGDLCCYWFEKARQQIEDGRCARAGLLATQGIRGGANRKVLERIAETGGTFFAVSDRDWILDGAMVHISMVAFDDGTESVRTLDGAPVAEIFANLSGDVDTTRVVSLPENVGISFMGDTKGGPFAAPEATLEWMLREPNPTGRPNSDVLRPWHNSASLLKARRAPYIIDFPADLTERQAALYEAPFAYVREHVLPLRQENSRPAYRRDWWKHVEPRPGMRAALRGARRYLATPTVSKFRLFAWLDSLILPDHQLIVFARADDYTFGVLQSRIHEVWARSQGTQVRERESGFRYIPTKTFEPFPFPPAAADSAASAVSTAAQQLDELRERWLNPPEWTRTEILEFPGSLAGPWSRYVEAPDTKGIGVVRYPRQVAKDEETSARLRERNLTSLYNQRPSWLDHAHRKLDDAVLEAYGWASGLSDEAILEKLLDLHRQRHDLAARNLA